MQDEVYLSGKHSKVMKMMPPPGSAATSLPCLAPLGHLTADKREIKDFPKLPSATSFIREALSAISCHRGNINESKRYPN